MDIIWLNSDGLPTNLHGRLNLPNGPVYGHVLWLLEQAERHGIRVGNKQRCLELYSQVFSHRFPAKFILRWKSVLYRVWLKPKYSTLMRKSKIREI